MILIMPLRLLNIAMTLSENKTSSELDDLEAKLDLLIEQYSQVKNENISLKSNQDTLIKEKIELQEKNTIVKARLEEMIARLKTMEQQQ